MKAAFEGIAVFLSFYDECIYRTGVRFFVVEERQFLAFCNVQTPPSSLDTLTFKNGKKSEWRIREWDIQGNYSARTLHCAAKSVKKRSGRDASSHHEVVLHGLMLVTGSRRLNCYYTRDIIADNIIRYRKKKQLTQMKLAELADLSVDSIKRIEGGQRSMSLENFLRLSDALQVPLSFKAKSKNIVVLLKRHKNVIFKSV